MGRRLTPLRLFFIAVGLVLLARLGLSVLVNLKIAEIRKEGLPATPKELEVWYTKPLVTNAADRYSKAFKLFPSDKTLTSKVPVVGTTTNLPPVGERLSATMKQDMEKYVEQSREFFELLRKANEAGECRFPLQLTDGWALRTSHIAPIRESARILQVHAVTAAENRDQEKAAQSVEAILDMTRALQAEPLMISQLVRMACDAVGIGTLERVLGRTALSKDQLIRLDRQILASEDQPGVIHALLGERCLTPSELRSGRLDEYTYSAAMPAPPEWWSKPRSFALNLVGVHELETLYYIDIVDRARVIAAGPWDAHGAGRMTALRTNAQNVPAILKNTRQFGWSVSEYLLREMRALAQKRCMRAALAVERFRNDKGRIPARLDELVPAYLEAVPVDPFSNQRVRLKRQPRGYLIYSVGEDFKDDGGSDTALRGIQPDIVIHIER